jgi:hypothetical protein
MTPFEWLEIAATDAAGRGLSDARPVLEGLARGARRLRDADWNEDASGASPPTPQAR